MRAVARRPALLRSSPPQKSPRPDGSRREVHRSWFAPDATAGSATGAGGRVRRPCGPPRSAGLEASARERAP